MRILFNNECNGHLMNCETIKRNTNFFYILHHVHLIFIFVAWSFQHIYKQKKKKMKFHFIFFFIHTSDSGVWWLIIICLFNYYAQRFPRPKSVQEFGVPFSRVIKFSLITVWMGSGFLLRYGQPDWPARLINLLSNKGGYLVDAAPDITRFLCFVLGILRILIFVVVEKSTSIIYIPAIFW